MQVICNGEEVISMGGTQETYNVDIWSGNHPFYQVRLATRNTTTASVRRRNRTAGFGKP